MARKRNVYANRQILADDVNQITNNNLINNQIIMRDGLGVTTGTVVGLDIAAGTTTGLIFPITSGIVSDGNGILYEMLNDTQYTLPDVDATFYIYAKHTQIDDKPNSGYVLLDVDTRTESYEVVNTRTYDGIIITGTTDSTLTSGFTKLGSVTVLSSEITARTDLRQYITVNNQTGYSIQNFIAVDNNDFLFSNKASGEIYNDNDPNNIKGFESKIFNTQIGTAFEGNSGTNNNSRAFNAIANNNIAYRANLFNAATGLVKLINNNDGLGEYIQATGNVSLKEMYSGSVLETVNLDNYLISQNIINHNLTNTSGVNIVNKRVRSSDGSKWSKINHFSDYQIANYYEQSGSAIGSYYKDISGNETTGVVFERTKIAQLFKSSINGVGSLPAVPTDYGAITTVGSGSSINGYWYNGTNWERLTENNLAEVYETEDLIVSGFTAVANNGGNCQFTYTGNLFDLADSVAIKNGFLNGYNQTAVTGNTFKVIDNGSNQYTLDGLTYDATATTGMVFVITYYKLKETVGKYLIDNSDNYSYKSDGLTDTLKIYMPSTGSIIDGQEWEMRIKNPVSFKLNNNVSANILNVSVYKEGAVSSDSTIKIKQSYDGVSYQTYYNDVIAFIKIRWVESKNKFILYGVSNT